MMRVILTSALLLLVLGACKPSEEEGQSNNSSNDFDTSTAYEVLAEIPFQNSGMFFKSNGDIVLTNRNTIYSLQNGQLTLFKSAIDTYGDSTCRAETFVYGDVHAIGSDDSIYYGGFSPYCNHGQLNGRHRAVKMDTSGNISTILSDYHDGANHVVLGKNGEIFVASATQIYKLNSDGTTVPMIQGAALADIQQNESGIAEFIPVPGGFYIVMYGLMGWRSNPNRLMFVSDSGDMSFIYGGEEVHSPLLSDTGDLYIKTHDQILKISPSGVATVFADKSVLKSRYGYLTALRDGYLYYISCDGGNNNCELRRLQM
ncbi:hypothetical protein [Bdellovibrio sp. HCB337]|uniref:hypothetical protein n=1 Tax=Bdellovibrio sp. HCB337 TaxID=3394358 RepID=UPI0039A6E1AE